MLQNKEVVKKSSIKKKAPKKKEPAKSKKPKLNLASGTASWKMVYKSGTWRFIHKPTENKLLSKTAATAKAEGKPLVITPVNII